ncbi:MAG: pilus assembly protein [Xanthomonadales bacterium]|nr:pilus assembly protein [Xanthomonadales bacterium]NIN59690.1 pilus assembly protein [Xanthomonadales bacterium]NIN75103.1 pilus assembly protein [Xanthomonadales bacterium]NIO15077.1 pilus assembly protein [Xanthomonadales bacterium]NIP12083.1 pilus assembly protein [Xanthomonadales bacterium]
MVIMHRDDLHRGGFAGLRETRMVMHPGVWGAHREEHTHPGLGRFVYLADARFNPHGETHLHPHREIDVISLMVEGRIMHEGSLEHGEELRPFDVQVQRAGGEGFAHNEVNPDATLNRMIQMWVVPERPGEPASYRKYHVPDGQRLRIYGGPGGQQETFAARTVVEVARVSAGHSIGHDSDVLSYVVSGSGRAHGVEVREGHLLSDESLEFTARENCVLILVSERPGPGAESESAT